MTSGPTVVLLTTKTPHHAWFARELSRQIPLLAVVVETKVPVPPFEIHHPFEEERDAYEREVLLGGDPPELDAYAETVLCGRANDEAAVSRVKRLAPDLLIIFGAGLIREPMRKLAGIACLNLHGGNPEGYRGLDSHLWAVYHEDWEGLAATLHLADDEFDTGDIVRRSPLPIPKGTPLLRLRSINTLLCYSLVNEALEEIRRTGKLSAHAQARRGRYYSFMPAPLKDICLAKWRRRFGA